MLQNVDLEKRNKGGNMFLDNILKKLLVLRPNSLLLFS